MPSGPAVDELHAPGDHFLMTMIPLKMLIWHVHETLAYAKDDHIQKHS